MSLFKSFNLSVLFIILILSGCASTPESNAPLNNNEKQPTQTEITTNTVKEQNKQNEQSDILKVPAIVTKAVDGDTVKVAIEGQEESIRMLLIDTPETSHPRLGVQPFGPEAKEFAKQVLSEGKTIELEFDVSGMSRDKYGRLLAYVWVDGKMYNEMVLEKGYARVAYIYAPNTRHVDRFREIQEQARQNQVGIWSIENYATDKGYNTDATEKSKEEEQSTTVVPPSTSGNNDCNIKGNISSSGDKIYHVPGGQFYERTKAEEMFCSESDAEKAGFRKSQR